MRILHAILFTWRSVSSYFVGLLICIPFECLGICSWQFADFYQNGDEPFFLVGFFLRHGPIICIVLGMLSVAGVVVAKLAGWSRPARFQVVAAAFLLFIGLSFFFVYAVASVSFPMVSGLRKR